mmetsp:Transcript_33132/g.84113  ORF Transcript_33132/g.84113 Transcript_33132/m.84113 type:complete len:100 (-) Transcript_33132:4628-4927(-)
MSSSRTRAQALSLYRQVLRAWRSWEGGEQERDYILRTAREEFRAARHLSDPAQIEAALLAAQNRVSVALHYKIPYPRLQHAVQKTSRRDVPQPPPSISR